jgi:2-polyprenyl-3-methyl-5-hydroxy-6-metoxy-1,4-benzoquinol methylase
MDEQRYFDVNRESWNRKADLHRASEFYDVDSWKLGKTSLTPLEIGEMGDVAGKTLLHLGCHFGLDTLSWARRGAQVTGCDLSDRAINYARQLAGEAGLAAHFVCCNLYDLPQHLEGQYDIVFTSYGVNYWLPDLDRWAAVISRFLKPGGFFYIADFHPIMGMFDEAMEKLTYPYHNTGAIEAEQAGTYAARDAEVVFKDYGWSHSLAETVNSLIRHGLRIEFLNEYPWSPFNCFNKSVRGQDGNYRIQGLEDIVPLVYSIKAVKGQSGVRQ